MEPQTEILFDDGGILVKYADGALARVRAVYALIDHGYTADEAAQHVARLEPRVGYWRKVPASKEENAFFDFTWTLRPAKKGPGAFFGTWFGRPA